MSSPYQESAPLACIFLGCSVCQWLHQANFHLSPGTALFFSHSLMLDGWIRLHVSQQPVARCCCALRMDGWVRRPEASDWDGVVCMAPVSGILTRLVVLDVVPDGRFGCGWWWVGRWVWHRGSTFLARLPVPSRRSPTIPYAFVASAPWGSGCQCRSYLRPPSTFIFA